MERVCSRALYQLAQKPPTTSIWICGTSSVSPPSRHERRSFTSTPTWRLREKREFDASTSAHNSYSQPAQDLSQDVYQVEKNHFDRIEEESKDKQMRSPWMREGSDKPPVARLRSAGAMTKGKLLTTPSRMLKLILPLTTRDANKDRKDIEPLALLVHPQQPLSYLERLIQSELPLMDDGEKERSPSIIFKAEDSTEEDIGSGKPAANKVQEDSGEDEAYELDEMEEVMVDGKLERTGKIKSSKDDAKAPAQEDDKLPAKEDGKLPVHGHEHSKPSEEDPMPSKFVRWSPSTEIGDFIRDASRGKEFAVVIEGAPPIYVGVPSFQDRTYYLRMRLRKTGRRISKMADIKRECDAIAHRGAKRVAQSGFLALIGWWGLVYYLTFKTSLGWDVMEPVTYLVGLSGLMGGYLWFLYHNREVSYKSAMNLTVSRQQSKLYEQKGFDLPSWEALIEEGNRLRREIKMVADEYDVEWDETKDEHDATVSEELRKERKKQGKDDKKKGKEDDDDDDD